MEIVTEEDYKYLCDIVLNIDQTVTYNNLEDIKHNYADLINSNRRLENIGSLNDLIKILEKRGCVSPKNVTILYDIASNFNQHHLLDAFHNRINLEHHTEKFHPYMKMFDESQTTLPPPVQTIKGKVHALICRALGKSWIDFARALDVQECMIDELKMKYSMNDRKICINQILYFHETNAHPRVWKTELLEALSKARRNDLRKSVQNIFDTFS